LKLNMLRVIAAKVVARREDVRTRAEKITERWVAGFLRRWGLGGKFGRRELDGQEVEEDAEVEDRGRSVKEDVLMELREMLDKETDPREVKRLALRIGEFAAEALEYQDALETMVERYNVALVRLQARHVRRNQESDDGDGDDEDDDDDGNDGDDDDGGDRS